MKVETFNDQIFFVTIRIETTTPEGSGVGTGFIVEHEIKPGVRAPFLVTNKHVIRGATSGRFFFIKSLDGKAPILGEKHDIKIDQFEMGWHGHEDPNVDVAIMPLVFILHKLQQQGVHVFFKSIPSSMFASDEDVAKLDAVEEVIFVGYPSGIFDNKNFLPIARKGYSATPISVDYNGRPQFLVDASVFRGSSGSPVFSSRGALKATRDGKISLGPGKPLLLGLVSGTTIRMQDGKIELAEIPTQLVPVFKYEQALNLGLVVKVKTIVETIQSWVRKMAALPAPKPATEVNLEQPKA